jgi:hypothetical protein
MSAKGARLLRPTFEGLVQNSVDGLILFEACLSGELLQSVMTRRVTRFTYTKGIWPWHSPDVAHARVM